jgi:hypothetical protein
MTNDERMPHSEGPNHEIRRIFEFGIRVLAFLRHSAFVIGHCRSRTDALWHWPNSTAAA